MEAFWFWTVVDPSLFAASPDVFCPVLCLIMIVDYFFTVYCGFGGLYSSSSGKRSADYFLFQAGLVIGMLVFSINCLVILLILFAVIFLISGLKSTGAVFYGLNALRSSAVFSVMKLCCNIFDLCD